MTKYSKHDLKPGDFFHWSVPGRQMVARVERINNGLIEYTILYHNLHSRMNQKLEKRLLDFATDPGVKLYILSGKEANEFKLEHL